MTQPAATMLRKPIALLATLLLAAFALIAVAATGSPAHAATKNINGNGGAKYAYTQSCPANVYYGEPDICLYYDGTASCFWGLTGGVSQNISASAIFHECHGNTDGKGHAVLNNANAMECSEPVDNWCKSFVNSNETGNADELTWGHSGELFYTWNNEASVQEH